MDVVDQKATKDYETSIDKVVCIKTSSITRINTINEGFKNNNNSSIDRQQNERKKFNQTQAQNDDKY